MPRQLFRNSRFPDGSKAANQEHNHHHDDHKGQQPAADVHDKSPFLRLAGARARPCVQHRKQKADVAEDPEVLHHVGLLANEPPGPAGLLSI